MFGIYTVYNICMQPPCYNYNLKSNLTAFIEFYYSESQVHTTDSDWTVPDRHYFNMHAELIAESEFHNLINFNL